MADTTEARRLADELDDETDSRVAMYGFEYADNRKAAAMLRALADRCDALESALGVCLHRGPKHDYAGLCPDETQPDSRDAECPACQVLIRADKEIGQ